MVVWAVSRGGFYARLTRPRSQCSRSDEELGAKVRVSFLDSDRTCGARAGVAGRSGGRPVMTASDRAFDAATRSQSPSAAWSTAPDPGERQVAAVAPNVLDAWVVAA